MTRWWRRNAVALVAIPVVVGLFAGGYTIQRELSAPDPLEPAPVVITDRKAPVDLAGFTLHDFLSGTFVAADLPGMDMPEGSKVVIIRFDGSVVDENKTGACSNMTLTEKTGARRIYDPANYFLDWDYDLLDAEPLVDSCRVPYDSTDGTFRTIVLFMVPEDSVGPYDFAIHDTSTGRNISVEFEANGAKGSED